MKRAPAQRVFSRRDALKRMLTPLGACALAGLASCAALDEAQTGAGSSSAPAKGAASAKAAVAPDSKGNRFFSCARPEDFLEFESSPPYAQTGALGVRLGAFGTQSAKRLLFNGDGLVLTRELFSPRNTPFQSIAMTFSVAGWKDKKAGDPVSLEFAVFHSLAAVDEKVKGRFWTLGSDGRWESGLYEKDGRRLVASGTIEGGAVKVGDTVEFILSGEAGGLSTGLKMRAHGQSVWMSNDLSVRRPQAVRLGFNAKAMKGAQLADVEVNAVGAPAAPVSSSGVYAAPKTADVKALFFGNSYQYFYESFYLAAQLAEGAEPPLRMSVTPYMIGGLPVDRILSDRDPAKAVKEGAPWNFVVIQSAVDNKITCRSPEGYFDAVRAFAKLVKEAGGAKIVLLQSSQVAPEDEPLQLKALETVAKELKADVSPAGLAFDKVASEHPEIVLVQDGCHPDIGGAYLIACVVYATITGRNPCESSFIWWLQPKEAKILQEAAWEAVRQEKAWRLKE